MEVDPGSVAGTAVDRFLDEPLARGLNGETAVDRFLDEPSDFKIFLPPCGGTDLRSFCRRWL